MINNFDGEFAFLSNFAVSPIIYENKTWPTVEHIFQAMKTLDNTEREIIRLSATPGKAKRLGKKVTLRPEWESVKKSVMLTCVKLKFSQNSELKEKLLSTNDSLLIEGNNWHDNTWGNCSCEKCEHIAGQNLLGKILMQVRSEL